MFFWLSFANAILDGSNAEEDLDHMRLNLLAMTAHAAVGVSSATSSADEIAFC